MTRQQENFNLMYHDALIKAAIGVHIIKTVGPDVGVSEEIQNTNIQTLCNTLAEGVLMDPDVVLYDVMNMHDNFPSEFFQYPEVMQLTGRLMSEMQRQQLIQ